MSYKRKLQDGCLVLEISVMKKDTRNYNSLHSQKEERGDMIKIDHTI